MIGIAHTAFYKEWLEEDNLVLLRGWARDGLSNAQIANNMGVTSKTLFEWRKKYPKINNALKKGKEVADYEVENALFKRACGYEYYEEKSVERNGNVEIIRTKKHVPPDPLSIFYYLKNRRPDKWRDKVEHNNADTYEDLTPIAKAIKLSDDDLKEMEKIKDEGGKHD